MKDGNATFILEKQLCDPSKLKESFKSHFNICSEAVDPIELKM